MECKEIDKNLVWVYTEFTLYKSTCISLLFETKESESFKVLQCQINDKIKEIMNAFDSISSGNYQFNLNIFAKQFKDLQQLSESFRILLKSSSLSDLLLNIFKSLKHIYDIKNENDDLTKWEFGGNHPIFGKAVWIKENGEEITIEEYNSIKDKFGSIEDFRKVKL